MLMSLAQHEESTGQNETGLGVRFLSYVVRIVAAISIYCYSFFHSVRLIGRFSTEQKADRG